jgi:hypothetical protein
MIVSRPEGFQNHLSPIGKYHFSEVGKLDVIHYFSSPYAAASVIVLVEIRAEGPARVANCSCGGSLVSCDTLDGRPLESPAALV